MTDNPPWDFIATLESNDDHYYYRQDEVSDFEDEVGQAFYCESTFLSPMKYIQGDPTYFMDSGEPIRNLGLCCGASF